MPMKFIRQLANEIRALKKYRILPLANMVQIRNPDPYPDDFQNLTETGISLYKDTSLIKFS